VAQLLLHADTLNVTDGYVSMCGKSGKGTASSARNAHARTYALMTLFQSVRYSIQYTLTEITWCTVPLT
jgi:hypothetical protein